MPDWIDKVALWSAVVASLPLVLCYLARFGLARDRAMPPWTFPGLIVAGGVGGGLFAVYGYPWLARAVGWFDWSVLPEGPLFYEAVLVPIVEELGKGLILLPFVFSRWYRGPFDGLLYGMAAGAGFAAFENFAYFTNAFSVGGSPGWATEVAARSFPSTVVHSGATAVFGGFLGLWVTGRRPWVRWGGPALALWGAVLVHGTWNGLVVLASRTDSGPLSQIAFAWLPVVLGGILMALARALEAERRGQLGVKGSR